MDDPNDYLIPELNSLSLEDSSNRSQWSSSGRGKQTPQLLNNQGYHPYFSPGGRSPKSIPKNDSTYPDTLVNFPQLPSKVLQFPISPPPTNSQPKRSVPLPALNSSPDKAAINMPFCRPFGGLLDSPLVYKHVGLTGQHALISPPPTLPMTTRTLPPTDSPHLRVIPEHEDLCREEGAPNDHEHRAHDSNEFQPSLLGLSSPRSHPNALYGGMSMPSTSTQSNPLLSPISPEWRVGRMHPDMTSPPYSYYPPIDSDSGASTSGSILLQHRPEFSAHTLERFDGPEMYDTPLSPVTSPFSRPILPPLDISSLLDSPSPSSCELSAYDCSPPSPPHTALTRGHPFIRDHNTNFVDGHDPQRLYTQKRKYLRNHPQMSPGSPPNPADQDELSVLSPYDYGYDSKPLKVFDDITENDDESDMDLSDDQLQEVLLATPEPSSPQPLPVAPPDPPPISDDLPDLAHEFAPGEMPWSPSLRAFSDLPDLDDGAGDDSEDFGSSSGSSSSSQFMDIDHFTESPKPSLLSLPGADIDEDLIPIDDDDETLLSAFPSPPSHPPDNGLQETPSQVHEESMKSWLPELDSNPFLGGSSSSAHWLPKPSSSTLPASTATHQTPSAANANEAGPSTARPPPPKRRSSSLLLVGDGMDDTPRNEGEAALSGENPLPPWRSSLTGGRERDEEDALTMQADASSDVELRRLSELMRKALRDEREAREAETRVLSGGTIAGSGWEIPATLSSGSGSVDLGGGRHLPTITRGAGIDMTAKREARKAKKKARERAREIGTMMKLKMAESGLQAMPSTSTSPDSPDLSDYSMSGDETSPEAAPSTNKKRKAALGEAKSMDELVAKMMLRRHARYRSLANRKTPLPPGRKYASSPLVRTRLLPELTDTTMGDIVDAGFSVDADGEEMEEAAEMREEEHERDPWTMDQD